jgi:catechol 2,3-dioxygenase-like lactoylglutathione lyase family enzyme
VRVPKVHHSAIGTRDVAASLRFWRDGLGFAVQMDQSFDGDWPTLFGGGSTTLRSIFLGDPATPDAGVVELVDLEDMDEGSEPPTRPTVGFFLLSLFADLNDVLPRLAALGVGGRPRIVAVSGVRLAVVHDPNGVRVELMDTAAGANLARLTSSSGGTERPGTVDVP